MLTERQVCYGVCRCSGLLGWDKPQRISVDVDLMSGTSRSLTGIAVAAQNGVRASACEGRSNARSQWPHRHRAGCQDPACVVPFPRGALYLACFRWLAGGQASQELVGSFLSCKYQTAGILKCHCPSYLADGIQKVVLVSHVHSLGLPKAARPH